MEGGELWGGVGGGQWLGGEGGSSNEGGVGGGGVSIQVEGACLIEEVLKRFQLLTGVGGSWTVRVVAFRG